MIIMFILLGKYWEIICIVDWRKGYIGKWFWEILGNNLKLDELREWWDGKLREKNRDIWVDSRVKICKIMGVINTLYKLIWVG